MSSSRWARSRRSALAAVAGAGMVAATLSTSGVATAAPPAPADRLQADQTTDFENGSYVVVMKDRPLVGYEGGIAGYPATKPAEGDKLNPGSAAAQKYRGLLEQRQDKALRGAGAATVQQRYTNTISGFSADLTGEQAAELAKDPTVLSVSPDELLQPDTSASPELLGLSGAGGVWERLGGVDGALHKSPGAGVVVGVVDTGIRPENPSFADTGMPKPVQWYGACDVGDAEDFACSNKLIGARYFVDGFGTDHLADHESVSPLDVDGHGTHTAGTAAGNHGVDAVVDGRDFGRVSGMAPAAHVAAYKVCWDDDEGGGGCATTDSVAAIDRAVADGVDVINFSISGTSSNYLAPVELAFMWAADAGIFVAASSGNSGPGASTTNHPSPWLTTVAASTHTIYEQTLVTGSGDRWIGASITEDLPSQTPMVLSEDIPAEGEAGEGADLCLPGSLDAEEAEGKLVVCDRGVNARVEKSDTVAEAGGVGMVLVNVDPGSLDTDLHAVPTVHLPHTVREDVRAYVAGESPTGAIEATNEGSTTQVPEVAGFSSRGPSLGAGGDILKPDVSAPGVGVLAAYSPRSAGRDFDFLSGTSMSSPHIAGLGALVKQAHPRWSPMAVKSAMMTTAVEHASAASSDAFAAGAGFVNPSRFLDPGLVYDSDQGDWWDFLAGQGVTYADGTPVSPAPIDASDLNQASIAIGSLAGTQTVTRTVTNVGQGGVATYRSAVSGLEGIDVKVEPATLRVRPNQTASFTVTFSRADAALGQYAKGELTWTGPGGQTVRSPLVVRPVAAATPASAAVAVDAESVDLTVTPGYTGTLGTRVHGLAKGTVTEATATNTNGATFSPEDDRNHTQDLTVPAGTLATRIELKAANPSQDDLDLFVQRKSDGKVVASAATGAADEVATVALQEGEYTIHVQAWAVAGAASSTTFGVRTFTVPTDDGGTLVFDPPATAVTSGTPVTLTGRLDTDGVSPYFGVVRWHDGSGQVGGLTFVSVG